MNERIIELANKANEKIGYTFKLEDANQIHELLEKFAELIVRETVEELSQQLYWHGEEQSNNPAYYKAIKKTLEHFGVEE